MTTKKGKTKKAKQRQGQNAGPSTADNGNCTGGSLMRI
jgi:hypothetical protein